MKRYPGTRSQSLDRTPRFDHMTDRTSYAVLFPGQGSQFVGMGADVFAARSDLLGPRAMSVFFGLLLALITGLVLLLSPMIRNYRLSAALEESAPPKDRT